MCSFVGAASAASAWCAPQATCPRAQITRKPAAKAAPTRNPRLSHGEPNRHGGQYSPLRGEPAASANGLKREAGEVRHAFMSVRRIRHGHRQHVASRTSETVRGALVCSSVIQTKKT